MRFRYLKSLKETKKDYMNNLDQTQKNLKDHNYLKKDPEENKKEGLVL